MASPMCATCLSQDRWLKPLRAFVPEQYASSWMKYGILPETLVCWECEANMLRVARFTSQVVQAQAILQKLQNPQKNKSKSITLKSMSKLAVRPTIQVDTDQLVANDNDCTLISDDEDMDTTQNRQVEIDKTRKRPVEIDNTLTKPTYVIKKNPPVIKVKDFANSPDVDIYINNTNNSSTSNILNNILNSKTDSVSNSENFILVNGGKSNVVALVPAQCYQSNTAMIGTGQPIQQPTNEYIAIIPVPVHNNDDYMSNLIKEIKTDYNITGDVSIPQNTNTVNKNTVGNIKIDNVVSLNPNSNVLLDKYNITPIVNYNSNNKHTDNYAINNNKNNQTVNKEEDVKINIFTLTETPVAVISNPTPSNFADVTLDFEDNIPVTKIITDDSVITKKQKQPHVLVEALPTANTFKGSAVVRKNESDKPNKSVIDENQHTVYSKSFESYITNMLNTRSIKNCTRTPIKGKPNIQDNKLQTIESVPVPNHTNNSQVMKTAQSEYLLKLLNYTQLLEQRGINRQHKHFKKKQYQCNTCIMGWNLATDYKSHYELFHSVTSPFKCGICSCRFEQRDEANAHFNKHFNIYACRMCKFAHYDLQEMKRHDCDGPPPALPPDNPTSTVDNRKRLSPGRQSSKPDTDKLPTCPHCKHKFVSGKFYKQHIATCIENTEQVELDVYMSNNNQRVDNVVEIIDDSDSGTEGNDLLVPRDEKKKKPQARVEAALVQPCVHCGRIIFKTDMEVHMKRRHPELIRLRANFNNK